MYKTTAMVASILLFVGILTPVSPVVGQTTNNLFDIYGNLSNSPAILPSDRRVEIYEASDNFAIVQVIDDPWKIYEDWRSPNIRSDRWYLRTDRALEARRETLGHHMLMRLRLEGQTTSNTGLVGAMQVCRVLNPLAINKIEVNFLIREYDVVGCEENYYMTRVRPAAISLNKFNDGSSTGLGDLTGDHFVRVMANREAFTSDPEGMLTVQAFLFRCIDNVCSNAISWVFDLDMGKVWVGEPFSLRISWDELNDRFLVGYNANPDVILAYNKALNQKPPGGPFADFHTQLVNGTCVEGPTVTDAEIKVREVRTNASAVIP